MSEVQKKIPDGWHRAVTAGDMIPWVDALCDPNPIHRDPAAAAAHGFGPHTVNPGPLNLAYACNAIARLRPDGEVRRIEARFVGNILSGDAVTATATRDDDGSCRASVTTGDGKVALHASVTFTDAA